MADRQRTATMRHIGWLHPAHSMTRILGDKNKAHLEARAPTDPTYTDGWVPVYAEGSGSTGEAT